jgi:formate dehydrogenase subunit gamma
MSGGDAILHGKVGTVSGGRVVRYSLMERINHWFGAIVYSYLLLTGLAFWSPYLFWIATVFGGGPSARMWHPWAGLAFFGSMIWMFRDWHEDMRITAVDLKWKDSVIYYIRNEDEKLPPVGRFNWGQKLLFWVMFWGAIALLISGIGLWFVNDIPWSLRFLRFWAVWIHAGVALITIGAIIIHVYMGTAMVRGGFSSIVRGEVSVAWAKEEHRLWYEKVAGGPAARK